MTYDDDLWLDLTDDAGRLERTASTRSWLAPTAADVTEGNVVGSAGWVPEGRTVSSGPSMLEEFVRLADAPDQSVVDYVVRWGFLTLCPHGLPVGPSGAGEPIPLPYCLAVPSVVGEVHSGCRGWNLADPIDGWRFWSGQARAILCIAARLADRSKGAPTDWSTLGLRAPWVPPDWDPELVDIASSVATRLAAGQMRYEAQAGWLGQSIDFWLRLAGVRLAFEWSVRRTTRMPTPTLVFETGGLFGALGIQVALAAAGRSGLVTCAGCGLPHQPAREPRADGRNYCLTCRAAGVPAKDAQRRYRERRKNADPRFLEREAARARERRRASAEGR